MRVLMLRPSTNGQLMSCLCEKGASCWMPTTRSTFCVASGMNKVALINDMEPETFTSVMDVNVTQSWLLARAASAQMKKQGNGGKIVLVSSARGLLAIPLATPPIAPPKPLSTGSQRRLAASWGQQG